jgi:hypothetical protein
MKYKKYSSSEVVLYNLDITPKNVKFDGKFTWYFPIEEEEKDGE